MPQISKKTEDQATATKERKPAYNDVTFKLYRGEDALTQEQAQSILGWQTETPAVKFGQDYLLKDANGDKVRCLYNAKNRPLYKDNYESLVQELLNRRWKFNGETIIIGKYKTLLNGQHSLIALILANQIRFMERFKAHYDSIWGDDVPVTMEKAVVRGVEETDEVINTMDTCKPRSYADVLYRADIYGEAKGAERKILCKMSEWAVKMAWHRTGAVDNPFAPRKTHSEAVEFLYNHPHLRDAVLHIYQENKVEKVEGESAGKPPISKFISPGYAAGLMYLMATSGTTEEQAQEYRAAEKFHEKNVDISRWEKAQAFWVDLAKSPSFDAVREALGRLADPATGAGGRREEKEAVIAKAWNVFVTDKTPKLSDLKLKHIKNADGIFELQDDTTQHFGGIDLGAGVHETTVDDESDIPTPEQLEERKNRVKEESLNGTLDHEEESEGQEENNEEEITEEVNDEDSVFDQFDSNGSEQETTEEEKESAVEEEPKKKKGKGKKPLLLDVKVPSPGSPPKNPTAKVKGK